MAASSSVPSTAAPEKSTNVRTLERDPALRAWVTETVAALDADATLGPVGVPAPTARENASPAPRATVAPWYLRAGFATLGTLAPPLATAWAEQLFLTAPRPPAPAKEVAALADAAVGSIVVNGQRLATWTWGHGPTVLLVHGWGGRGGQLAGFAPALVAAGYSVVAFDAPGHGASEGRTSSLVEVARAVKGVAAGLPSPVHAVVAHSMGGAATALALDWGLEAARVVFVAPPVAASDWTGTFRKALGLRDEVLDAMQRRIEARLQVPWSELDMRVVAPRMRTPLLVIHDVDDKEVPVGGSRVIVSAWPGAALHTTEKLGHKRILDDLSVIERAVSFIVA